MKLRAALALPVLFALLCACAPLRLLTAPAPPAPGDPALTLLDESGQPRTTPLPDTDPDAQPILAAAETTAAPPPPSARDIERERRNALIAIAQQAAPLDAQPLATSPGHTLPTDNEPHPVADPLPVDPPPDTELEPPPPLATDTTAIEPAPPAPDPAPTDAPHEDPDILDDKLEAQGLASQWDVQPGEDLIDALQRWTTRTATWRAVKETHYRWPIDAEATFTTTFLSALSQLQQTMAHRRPAPVITAYHQNHIIVLQDDATKLY